MPRGKRRPHTPAPSTVYSIREFCESHGISEALYYRMKRRGEGPREMKVGARILISHESAAAWRRAQER
jgi:predicted DNA-binding transcriptional regulator AlpA